MINNIEALIFDMDGTMIDSMRVWKDIDDEYIEKYDLTEPEDFHEAMEGLSYTETAEYFLKVFPTLPKTVEDLKAEWYEMALYKYSHEMELKEGLEEVIRGARAKGIRIGIATSNDRKLVEACLRGMGVEELVDTISTGCEVKKGKPAPDVYLKAAGDLGVAPENCLVFEDVPMGIMAGKNAGMKVCAVYDWFSASQTERKKELADYFIKNYKEILNYTFEVL